MSSRNRYLAQSLMLAFFITWPGTSALAQKMPESAKGPSVSAKFFEGSPADYAGINECRSCHKPEFREYEKTSHAKVEVPGKGYISGCEVCHGPGKAHADAIEAAEGDEAKTAKALDQHPIFPSVSMKRYRWH